MPARIAVIDDEPVFRDLLRELLTEEGYEPHLFADAEAAWARVRALAPRAIIVDLRLGPGAGGATGAGGGAALVERLRADPATRAIPLILCSGDLPALRAGGAAWAAWGCHVLAKPFDLDDLLALLRHVVGTLGEPDNPGDPGGPDRR